MTIREIAVGRKPKGFAKLFADKGIRKFPDVINITGKLNTGRSFRAMALMGEVIEEFIEEHGKLPRVAWFDGETDPTKLYYWLYTPGEVIAPFDSLVWPVRYLLLKYKLEINLSKVLKWDGLKSLGNRQEKPYDIVVIDLPPFRERQQLESFRDFAIEELTDKLICVVDKHLLGLSDDCIIHTFPVPPVPELLYELFIPEKLKRQQNNPPFYL